MSSKHSPRKVTLAMIKGKPITTSVPVIHYHASDDELEEIYPNLEEEKRLTLEFEGSCSKITSTSDNVSDNNSETRSISTENTLPEGTPPSLDPWKVLSQIKGKITRTFEEKLSEMKSDKTKLRHSRTESSSISDLDDHGCTSSCDKTIEEEQVNESITMTDPHQRDNPVRYVGFSNVKTGLKDKSLQDECVESGIEASEFAQNVNEDIASCPKNKFPTEKPSNNDNYTTLQQQSYMHSTAFPKQINFKTIFSCLMQQLIFQMTYKSVAIFIAIFCVYYITPLPEYLLGFIMGTFTTVTFYSMLIKFKTLLTTLPDETLASNPIIPVLEIPAAEEHAVIERFQGWLNELPYNYEPNNYHVARTKSVFFRLEGNILRVMETRMKIPKKAVWDEPKHKLKFVRKRIYNLTGARIELVPYGLARRRRWSKKYPICITLKKGASVCNAVMKNSINDCYDKVISKRRIRYSSNREWEEEMHNEDESCFISVTDEESIVKQNKKKEEDKGVVENNRDESYYNHDSNNDDIDNKHVEYEEYFSKNEEAGEYMVEEKRKRKEGSCRKERQKEIDKVRSNVYRKKKRSSEQKQQNERLEDKKKENDEGKGKEEGGAMELTRIIQQTIKKEKKNKEGGCERKENMLVKKKIGKEDEKERKQEYDELRLEEEEKEGEEDDSDDADDDDNDDDCDDSVDDDFDDDDETDENYEEEEEVEEEIKVDDLDGDDNENKQEKSMIDKEGDVNNKEGGVELAFIDNNDKHCSINTEKEGRNENNGVQFINLKSSFNKLHKKNKQRKKFKIFVFARTDREKEDWYRRLISAASRGVKRQDSGSYSIITSSTSNVSLTVQKNVTVESKGSLSANSSNEKNVPELNYNAYMAKYLDIGGILGTLENACSTGTDNTLWFNCLIARILFDVHKCPETISLIKDKMQRKLSNIKLPYFMECLLVSEIMIGQGAPIIRSITKPITNERGLWLDFDLTYKGSLTMTVETKLNLMKLTRTGSVPSNSNVITSPEKHESIVRSPIFDSDLEDTPETSTEDDDASTTQLYNTTKETTTTQSSGRKFLSMVDKIAANKYFQHATELSYVRRAMEGVSNTEIRLMVTISSIEGCLSVNIPPAPSDRLWYGFKPVPKVTLTVKPAVGERTVNIVYVTKWIEAKLLREFEKLVVLPNMDDLVLPLCPNYPYMTMR